MDLVQEGERICGDFGAALVNLRQVDEGVVLGSAIGSTAVLAVTSNRNGAVVLVRAERSGDFLHWRVVDEVAPGSNDIDVIAADAVLKRDGLPNAGRTCESVRVHSKASMGGMPAAVTADEPHLARYTSPAEKVDPPPMSTRTTSR